MKSSQYDGLTNPDNMDRKRWRGLQRLIALCQKTAKTIRQHLYGIINAIVLKANKGIAESINAKIQKVKAMACGFRNRERFRNAIYFHLGELDLYPRSAIPNALPT